jgi:decaprenylphospho-beta-D-ribofuranose 2-oxidase
MSGDDPRPGEPRAVERGVRRELSGWGNRPRSVARVVPPQAAEPNDRGMLARGLGRSYGDAALNAGGTVVDMTATAGLQAFDAERGAVRAEAGMSLADLLRVGLPFGWFPPVTPGTRHVTLGGALACDVHGKNHHVDGSFAHHVERFGLLDDEGIRRDVTPTDAAFAATAGGMGLTGIVADLTLRLTRVGSAWMRVRTERTPDLDTTMERMAVLDRGARYAVAWVDLLAPGRSLGRGVLTTGDHAEPDEVPARARRRPLAADHEARLAVPPVVPSGLLTAAAVRGFNELYWRRAPSTPVTRPEPIGAFFYPLDVVDRWNRVYGPAGFVQYQFVVPTGAEQTVRAVVAALARARIPSFLAVLKRFGPGTGMLSFPIEGWTLALDVPAGVAGLPDLLDRFDEQVAGAGGRVYLAKDGRLRPELLAAMYPDLDRWRAVRDQLDPGRRMRSDLARRLRLLDDEEVPVRGPGAGKEQV